MAYALQRNEPFSTAIPRIVIERIDLALDQLLDERETAAERIHNARKRFKESRAAVRLVRFSLGDQFRIENAWFRDAGRSLATLRDADAMVEAVANLAEHADGYHERRMIRRLRRRFALRQSDATKAVLRKHIDETARALPAARERVRLWPHLPDDFTAIGPGFRRTFRDGRRAARAALQSPSPETFHDWRKRVKDHWYHVQILREVQPDFTKPYRAEIELLSDTLGDRHDLDVLRQTIDSRGAFGNDFELRVLHAMIDRRISELAGNAAEIGARIYAETPKVLHDRFESSWAAWGE